MKKIEVNIDAYELYITDVEGQSAKVIAYTNSEQAIHYFTSKSAWHNARLVSIHKTYYVVGDVKELTDVMSLDKREAALAKLTDEDKKVLGLL